MEGDWGSQRDQSLGPTSWTLAFCTALEPTLKDGNWEESEKKFDTENALLYFVKSENLDPA